METFKDKDLRGTNIDCKSVNLSVNLINTSLDYAGLTGLTDIVLKNVKLDPEWKPD